MFGMCSSKNYYNYHFCLLLLLLLLLLLSLLLLIIIIISLVAAGKQLLSHSIPDCAQQMFSIHSFHLI